MSDNTCQRSKAVGGVKASKALLLLASSAMTLLHSSSVAASADYYWSLQDFYDGSYGNPVNWTSSDGSRPQVPTITDTAYFSQYSATGDDLDESHQAWHADRWILYATPDPDALIPDASPYIAPDGTYYDPDPRALVTIETVEIDFAEGGGLYNYRTNAYLWTRISGPGGVYNYGGTLELTSFDVAGRSTGYSDYTGKTIIYGGKIRTDNTGLSMFSDVEIVSGALEVGAQSGGITENVLAIDPSAPNGTNTVIGSLAGAGSVVIVGNPNDRDGLYHDGGLVTGATNASTTYSGTISGNGSLTKIGTGTFTMTGVVTHAGGTRVSGGTLVGDTDSLRGRIENSATVVFDQAPDGTFAGTLASLGGVAGQMVKQGAGVLTLTGTSVLPWTVSAGGLVSASDRFSGDLELAAGTSFTFDQTYAGTYAGEITGAGDVAFLGGGLVSLTGESNAHTGTSTVAGSLAVNGTHAGQIAVVSGGILQGSGIAGSTTVASGGTIAPGNSIGTLAIRSDLAFAAGSTYRVEVAGDGRSDRLDVVGTATLSGADIDLVLDASDSYVGGGRYAILHAGAVDGRFAPVELDSAFLLPSLDYTPTDVSLTLAPAYAAGEPLFATVAETANQREAATALDGLDQTDGSAALSLYNAILFSGAADARAAFDQLSGEIAASVRTGLIEDSRHIRNAMTDRLATALATTETASSTSGPDEGVHEGVSMGGSGAEAWIGAYGSWGETNSDGNAAGHERDAQGLLVGLDAPVLSGSVLDAVRIGVLAGYGSSSAASAARAASAGVDSYHIGLYGGGALGPLDLAAGAAYSRNEVDTFRAVGFAGFGDVLSARFDAGTAQVFGEASTRLDLGAARLSPFANLSYVSVDADAYGEAGGAAALSVSGGTGDATLSTLGLRASAALPLGAGGLTAKAMLGWRHAYGDTSPLAALAFAGGNAFAVEGAPIAEDAAVVDLGLAAAIAPQASLSLHYAGQIASDARDDGITARLGIRF